MIAQTLSEAYVALITGESYRVAIGSFINSFFLYNIENRQQLLDEPIQVPENPTLEQLQWAAFCAGAAEYLADRYGLVCPVWASNAAYALKQSWCILSDASQEAEAILAAITPAAFQKRNVVCGNREFTNQHPSSREPGSLAELQQRRQRNLEAMSPEGRAAYLKQMVGKPRVHILA